MMSRVLFLFTLVAFSTQGQEITRTFLMYQRINGQSIDDSTNQVLAELTLFMVRGLLTQTDSKAFTGELNVLDNKVVRKIKWDVHATGTNIQIKNRNGQLNGIILSTPAVGDELFSDRNIQFLLFPIELGIPIKQLIGRYVITRLNQKDTINLGDIRLQGRYKGLQETKFDWKINDRSGTEFGLTKYSSPRYNNLIYLGGMNHFLQPISIDSDSVLTCNLFLAQFEKPGTIFKSEIKIRRLGKDQQKKVEIKN